MLFGEYELSPGLIGLSLLPAPHPEAFQRLSVRPSIPRYRDFSLGTGRSPGFASAADDWAPSSDSLSLRLRASSRLTSPATATRRLIMQKARRHTKKCAPTACRRMVSGTLSLLCERCFSPFPHGTCSLSVSGECLALADGPAGFTQGSTCPALLRSTTWPAKASRKGLSPAMAALSRAFRSPTTVPSAWVLQPRPGLNRDGLGYAPFARHYLGYHVCFLFLRLLRCFSSPRSPPRTRRG